MGRDFSQVIWIGLMALIVLIALPGCGSDTAVTEVTSSHFSLDITGDSELHLMRADDGAFEGTAYGVAFRFEGVSLEIPGHDASVDDTAGFEGTGHGGALLISVNGHAGKLVDDELFLGTTSYGTVVEGDDVVVGADGVTVNGVSRGAIPEATS